MRRLELLDLRDDVGRRLDEPADRDVRDVQGPVEPRDRVLVAVGVVGQQVAGDHRRGQRVVAAVARSGRVVRLVGHRRHVGHARQRNLVVAADEHDVTHAGRGPLDRAQLAEDRVDDRVGLLGRARFTVPGGEGGGHVAVGVEGDDGGRAEPVGGHGADQPVERVHHVARRLGTVGRLEASRVDEQERVGVSRDRRGAAGRAGHRVREGPRGTGRRGGCGGGVHAQHVRLVAGGAVVAADLDRVVAAGVGLRRRRGEVDRLVVGAAVHGHAGERHGGQGHVLECDRREGAGAVGGRGVVLDRDRGERHGRQRHRGERRRGHRAVDDEVVVGAEVAQLDRQPRPRRGYRDPVVVDVVRPWRCATGTARRARGRARWRGRRWRPRSSRRR